MAADREAGKLAQGAMGSPIKGARGGSGPPLAGPGVDKHLADRARKDAALPEDQFEASVEKSVKRAVAAVQGVKQMLAAAKADRTRPSEHCGSKGSAASIAIMESAWAANNRAYRQHS